MAPKKRVSRTVKEANNNNYNDLTLNNVLCPICRNILIEPVSLSCNHSFCLSCFEGIVSKANLTCPLCRVRFGSWHRIAKKENKIVNTDLWNAVQKRFPQQVKNRLEGVEENLDEEPPVKVRVASPGSIRREYEQQKHQEEEEIQKEREAEEKASEQLIKKIRQEEEYAETIRKEKLRLDEKVARQLAEEIGVISKPGSSKSLKKIPNLISAKKNTLDKYLVVPVNVTLIRTSPSTNSKNMCQDEKPQIKNKTEVVNNIQKTIETNASVQTVSDNEIDSECKYFKPIEPAKSNTFKIVSPVKVPVKVKRLQSVIIRSPKGKKEFKYQSLNSPFVYFKPPQPYEYIDLSYQKLLSTKRKFPIKSTKPLIGKINIANKCNDPPSCTLPKKQCVEPMTKITNNKCIKVPSFLIQVPPLSNNEASCSSWNASNSPFRGFPNNNKFLNYGDEEFKLKKQIQEKEDREFALKLHEELNSNGRLNSIRSKNLRKRKRQATLEELVDPINTAK